MEEEKPWMEVWLNRGTLLMALFLVVLVILEYLV